MVGAVTVQRSDFGLPDNATAGASVPCPAGTRAIGGGSSVAPTTADDIQPTVSRPDRTGVEPDDDETFNGWRVAYHAVAGIIALKTVAYLSHFAN